LHGRSRRRVDKRWEIGDDSTSRSWIAFNRTGVVVAGPECRLTLSGGEGVGAQQGDAVVERCGNRRRALGQWDGVDVQRVLAIRVWGWMSPVSESGRMRVPERVIHGLLTNER
jgi:hypothetical protein